MQQRPSKDSFQAAPTSVGKNEGLPVPTRWNTGAGQVAVSAYKCRRKGWRVAVVDELPYGGTCALRGLPQEGLDQRFGHPVNDVTGQPQREHIA